MQDKDASHAAARDRHPLGVTGAACHRADGLLEGRFQGRTALTRKLLPWAWVGTSSAPTGWGRIQLDQSRQLLLIIRSDRPILAGSPLTDLSFKAPAPGSIGG